MKKIFGRLGNIRNKILYTLLVVVLLVTVFFSIVNYIYREAENDGYENLHIQTKEIKEDITLQLISDRENLSTMANFASKLYSDGEGFGIMMNSFKSVGLIENIGILMPDNTFVTKVGTIDAPNDLKFEEEVIKGEYISGRVKDATNPEIDVVRSAVPIVADGKTVAILYGVIKSDTLEQRYKKNAEDREAQLYVVERGNGNFIFDTQNNELKNITSLKTRKYKGKFSYEKLKYDVDEGISGYSSFVSKFTGEVLYIHYSPLEIGDWMIMLAEPEKNVFAEVQETRTNLFFMFLMVLIIMIFYILLIFSSERKQSKMNFRASSIRKLLLEINQQEGSITAALASITMFAKSRSAFFIDTDGDDFNYIIPSMKQNAIYGDERNYIILKLFNYAGTHRKEHGVAVYVDKVIANKSLNKEMPDFYEFLIKHNIKKISFTIIVSNNNNTSMIGVINPKRSIDELLKDIAVCFSMAIYNKKYLNKTELVASTDSLTGLSNRMAYNKDILMFDYKMPEQFSCIYVDVNELHIINNKYGHAAGDEMLLYIANTLKEVFNDCHIYRMGGDEFLVFTENMPRDEVARLIDKTTEKIEERNYHISVGMDFRSKNINSESLVKEAEKRMYEAKARYYQEKEQRKMPLGNNIEMEYMATDNRELDAILKIMGRRYCAVYIVSTKTEAVRRILSPKYLKEFFNDENLFSKAFSYYIHELVNPDYHRSMLNFLNFDVLNRRLVEGSIPSITYVKNNGEKYRFSVYLLFENDENSYETMWLFEKEV